MDRRDDEHVFFPSYVSDSGHDFVGGGGVETARLEN